MTSQQKRHHHPTGRTLAAVHSHRPKDADPGKRREEFLERRAKRMRRLRRDTAAELIDVELRTKRRRDLALLSSKLRHGGHRAATENISERNGRYKTSSQGHSVLRPVISRSQTMDIATPHSSAPPSLRVKSFSEIDLSTAGPRHGHGHVGLDGGSSCTSVSGNRGTSRFASSLHLRKSSTSPLHSTAVQNQQQQNQQQESTDVRGLRDEMQHWKGEAEKMTHQIDAMKQVTPNRHWTPTQRRESADIVSEGVSLSRQRAKAMKERWAHYQESLKNSTNPLLDEMFRESGIDTTHSARSETQINLESAAASEDGEATSAITGGLSRVSSGERSRRSRTENSRRIDRVDEHDAAEDDTAWAVDSPDHLEDMANQAQRNLERASLELLQHKDLLSYENELLRQGLMDEIAEKDRKIQAMMVRLGKIRNKLTKAEHGRQATLRDVDRLREILVEREHENQLLKTSLGRVKRELNVAKHDSEESQHRVRVANLKARDIVKIRSDMQHVTQELSRKNAELAHVQKRVLVLQAVRTENERLHRQLRQIRQRGRSTSQTRVQNHVRTTNASKAFARAIGQRRSGRTRGAVGTDAAVAKPLDPQRKQRKLLSRGHTRTTSTSEVTGDTFSASEGVGSARHRTIARSALSVPDLSKPMVRARSSQRATSSTHSMISDIPS